MGQNELQSDINRVTEKIINCVIVEMKAAKTLDEVHSAQCMNYLKATGLKVCLLVNFGRPRVDIKRIVLDF